VSGLTERLKSNTALRVLAVYLGASWVVLQVVDVVKQNMGLPDWVFPFALILLVIGLPIMLTTAMLQGRPARPTAELTESSPSAPLPADRSPRRFFTWRNALLGGAAALVLLAGVTTGFMFMRNQGIGPVGSLVAKGVLEERSRIVLAEFDAEDPVLGRTVTESFRADLAQSTIVHLVEPDSIADALSRMGREPETELTEATARELAMRDGFPAIVAGEVAPLGDGYVLTTRLVSSTDGAVLASARASARDQNGLLEAIDEASSKLREQIGESYTSLRETPSLAHVTTSSLEALKKYTQAEDARHREGNPEAAIVLLEEAVAIDTAFALAYRDLATILANTRGSWDRRIGALERAYRHRDRLTERERYLVEAAYAQDVLDDRTRSIQAYEAMLRLDSLDAQAFNNIGFNYWMQGDFERAGEFYRQAREVDPSATMYAGNVGAAWANLGEIEKADSAYALLDDMPGSVFYERWRALFAYQRGDEVEARRRFEALAEENASQSGLVRISKRSLGLLELLHGRLGNADSLLLEATALDERGGRVLARLSYELQAAFAQLSVTADTAAALERVQAALADYPPQEIAVLDRPWVGAAGLAAGAGDAELARSYMDARDSEVSDRFLEIERRSEHTIRAWIAWADGEGDRAISEMREQPPSACPRCLSLDFALLFDALGQADSAIARYREYLETPANFNLWLDAHRLAPVHESLGRLYDEKGDLDNAALHYAQFVDLWEDADPVLQPRVEAARARLQGIVRERG
jgi:tetratricopeptide (TPR) repeat protein